MSAQPLVADIRRTACAYQPRSLWVHALMAPILPKMILVSEEFNWRKQEAFWCMTDPKNVIWKNLFDTIHVDLAK